MSFSGREIFLILRARDEASRTLHRVSRSMSKMDIDAANASSQVIREHRDNLYDLQNRLNDVNTAYSNTAAQARTLYQTRMDQALNGMTELRRRTDDVHRAYQYTVLEAQRLRQTGKLSADQYQKQMLEARELRTQNLQDIQRERYVIEDAQRAIQHEYHQTMQDARKLHLQQKDDIKSEMAASQDQIRMHEERIRSINAMHEAQRAHGRQLMRNGTSALYFGAALATIGAVGVYAYTRTTKAAMDYAQAAATTLTQVDNTKVSLEEIKDIGLEVARVVPVAFEQIQPALYDIFSSIDVNTKEARILLKQFAQDAVAGQTDMETATRANIAIMNAYKIKVKDASKVSDFMFRLVQKGVGTYHEFATTIGRAIPSAKRAGQSYQTLGAMMAFLTRNGLSAAMAATSSARALDAISHPKTVARLEEIGIKVKNMHGEFKPLPEILDEMNNKFGKMKGPERATALQDLFKSSGGTAQARRFFDTYFKNSKEFNKRVKEMGDTAGIAKEKFEDMADTSAAKLQKMKNRIQELKIKLGDDTMPVMIFFMETISGIIDAFLRLPEPIRKTIAIFGLVATVLTVVAGLGIALAGAYLLVQGAAILMGATMGALVGTFAGVLAVFALIGLAAYLVYKNWDKIRPKLKAFWNGIKDKAQEFRDWFDQHFGQYWEKIREKWANAFNQIKQVLSDTWQKIKDEFKNNQAIKDAIAEFKDAWKDLAKFFEDNKKEIMMVVNLVGGSLVAALLLLVYIIAIVGPAIVDVFGGALKMVAKIIGGVVDIITGAFGAAIGSVELFANLFTGNWTRLWTDVKNIFTNLWTMITGIFNLFVGIFISPFETVARTIIGIFMQLYDVLVGHSIVPDLVKAIIMWFSKLPGAVIGVVSKLIGAVIGKFASLGAGAIQSVIQLTTGVRAKFAELPGRVKEAISSLPSKVHTIFSKAQSFVVGILTGLVSIAWSKGYAIVSAIARGLRAGLEAVRNAANDIAAAVARRIPGSPVKEGPLTVLNNGRAGKLIAQMVADGMLAGVPLISKAADAIALAALATDSYKGSKAKQRKKALKDALELQKQLLEESKRYNDQIKSSIKSYGSLSSIETPTDVFGNTMPMTTQTVISGLQQKLSVIKTFGANLRKMKEMGYNSWIIDQVAQMGPEAGAEMAAALIAAMPDDVSQVNSLMTEIDSQAKEIGTFAADSMYGAGIATVEGLIAGLQSKDKKIRDAAIKIAKEIIDAIKGELGIASPSKVAQYLGSNFGSSMADAIASEEAAIRNAARMLGSAAQDELSGRPFIVPTTGFTSTTRPQGDNPPTQIIQNDIDIHTNEIDPQATAAELGFALAERFRL